nr:hypothetical protein [Tanacetum cinerariifolium]
PYGDLTAGGKKTGNDHHRDQRQGEVVGEEARTSHVKYPDIPGTGL